VAVITVEVQDEQGCLVPTACDEIRFALQGPGRIIGVGNGDPISHEAECYFDVVSRARIHSLKEKVVENLADRHEVAAGFDDSDWKPAFQYQVVPWDADAPAPLVVRGVLELAPFSPRASLTLLTKSVVDDQSIYVNGHLVAANISRDAPGQAFPLPHEILNTVVANEIAITGRHFCRKQWWEEPNTDPGLVQVIEPAPEWKRRVFNGLAQVIIQSVGPAGEMTLTAAADGLTPATVRIQANGQSTRP
jgi:beta-galactosidase